MIIFIINKYIYYVWYTNKIIYVLNKNNSALGNKTFDPSNFNFGNTPQGQQNYILMLALNKAWFEYGK